MRTKKLWKTEDFVPNYVSVWKGVSCPASLGISNSFWGQKSESILFNYHYRLVELNELRIFCVIISLVSFQAFKDQLKTGSSSPKTN